MILGGRWRVLFILLFLLTCGGTACAASGVRVSRAAHLGWTNAWMLDNGTVEVVVVPETGRVMQFQFVGETNGPFWENPQLAGRPMPEAPWTAAHGSFGGDKTWPAPQSAWNWPPPDVFDAVPVEVRADGDTLVLTSPISPRFGIRTERRVSLAPAEPVLRIRTRIVKVSGDPVEVGVWVITQVRDPVAVFLPIPSDSRFPQGTTTNWGVPSGVMTRSGNLLRLTRDPRDSHKIGNDGTSLVWIGRDAALRIDVPRVSGGAYGDDGCSVEVYTNPDPVPYVELETLGPIRRLSSGEAMEMTNSYTLFRRVLTDEEAEARRILATAGTAPR